MPSKILEGKTRGEHASNRPGRGLQLVSDADAEFGGTEARKKLERRLLRKVDIRMSFLVLIYIPNYVSCTL